MVSGSKLLIVMVKVDGRLLSVPLPTSTVKVELPAEVGVPVMAPDAALRLKPGGSEPEDNVQAYVGPPPATCKVAE